MLRLSPPTGRRIENADVLEVHAAGAEANVLAALARLGVPSALVSALPETPLGRRAAAELAAAGVDLHRLRWAERRAHGDVLRGARSGRAVDERPVRPRRIRVRRDLRWPHGSLDGVQYALVSGITPALSAAAPTRPRPCSRRRRIEECRCAWMSTTDRACGRQRWLGSTCPPSSPAPEWSYVPRETPTQCSARARTTRAVPGAVGSEGRYLRDHGRGPGGRAVAEARR